SGARGGLDGALAVGSRLRASRRVVERVLAHEPLAVGVPSQEAEAYPRRAPRPRGRHRLRDDQLAGVGADGHVRDAVVRPPLLLEDDVEPRDAAEVALEAADEEVVLGCDRAIHAPSA